MEMTFTTKINIPSVNQNNGKVDNLNILKQWKSETNIETILVALKNEMLANKSKKQPAEGQTYWLKTITFYFKCEIERK